MFNRASSGSLAILAAIRHIKSPGRRFNSAGALAQPSEGWDARLALGGREKIDAILGQPLRQSNLSKVSLRDQRQP